MENEINELKRLIEYVNVNESKISELMLNLQDATSDLERNKINKDIHQFELNIKAWSNVIIDKYEELENKEQNIPVEVSTAVALIRAPLDLERKKNDEYNKQVERFMKLCKYFYFLKGNVL